MKPGPATAARATQSDSGKASAMRVASSRGFIAAVFASTIAMFEAKSPFRGSRVRSTWTSLDAGTPARARAARAQRR